jgi:translation initiation factor 1
MAKFKTKLNLDGGLVYSTNPDFELPDDSEEEIEVIAPEKQMLKLQIRKLKGGKVATVIMEFKGPEAEMEKLAKQLKNKCACGGSAKEGEIILQGDFIEKVKKELTALGYKHKGGK